MFVARAVVASGGFAPSGMTLGTTFNFSSTGAWLPVTGFTADTTNYPGSTVAGDGGLLANGGVAAVLSAQAAWQSNVSNHHLQLRLLVNGTVVATGTQITSGTSGVSANATVSTNYTIANGDDVLLQANADNTNSHITSGSSTFVHIVAA
jgi:hypothetical protein